MISCHRFNRRASDLPDLLSEEGRVKSAALASRGLGPWRLSVCEKVTRILLVTSAIAGPYH